VLKGRLKKRNDNLLHYGYCIDNSLLIVGEAMKTYMISYMQNGKSVRENKNTLLNPKAIAGFYKSKGCENVKVRVIG
jgi:hypothetical protein